MSTAYRNVCGRCGAGVMFIDCIDCDGEGATDDTDPCLACDGDGFATFCLDGPAVGSPCCETFPLPGMEDVPSGTPRGVRVQ